jgi:hypothetical protein
MVLYFIRFEVEANGLTWLLYLTMRHTYIMSLRVLHALYADPTDSFATARGRREPVTLVVIPMCDGGSHVSIRIGDRADTHISLPEAPPTFINRERYISCQYARHIRRTQPIKPGARLLMTQHDRATLILLIMAMQNNERLPPLPNEIIAMVLAFLNMSDIPLTQPIKEK